MPSWRVVVHALDRTGPPMLALALLRWWHRHRPADPLQVVAFRGGPLERDVERFADLTVLLEPSEAWDHDRPDAVRVYQLRQRTQALPEPAATLLVSVAAGQALTLLGPGGPVTTWVVEQGEDLHWLEPPVDVARRTDRWLAGSDGTAAELALRLGERGLDGASTIDVVPEFIDPVSPDPVAVSRRRRELCDRSSLVVGAGIGTHRKGPDLFLEAALDSHRRRPGRCRFVWIGGETDPLVPALRDEVGRLRMGHVIHFEPSVSDIDTCVAAADALLHTARLDAFPLICLHAAAAGTPVVAFSGTGGVEEMFGGGFVGAPFPDITMLTARLHEVLDDPAPVVAAQQRRVEERYVTPVAAPAVCEHLLRSASVGGTP